MLAWWIYLPSDVYFGICSHSEYRDTFEPTHSVKLTYSEYNDIPFARSIQTSWYR